MPLLCPTSVLGGAQGGQGAAAGKGKGMGWGSCQPEQTGVRWAGAGLQGEHGQGGCPALGPGPTLGQTGWWWAQPRGWRQEADARCPGQGLHPQAARPGPMGHAGYVNSRARPSGPAKTTLRSLPAAAGARGTAPGSSSRAWGSNKLRGSPRCTGRSQCPPGSAGQVLSALPPSPLGLCAGSCRAGPHGPRSCLPPSRGAAATSGASSSCQAPAGERGRRDCGPGWAPGSARTLRLGAGRARAGRSIAPLPQPRSGSGRRVLTDRSLLGGRSREGLED